MSPRPDHKELAVLAAHTDQVLGFAMSGRSEPKTLPPLSDAELERQEERILRHLAASGRNRLVLLGLGTGHLADRLARSLPADALMVCCDRSPERVRAANSLPEGLTILADTSTWTHACLLALCGWGPGQCQAVLNPELTGAEREAHQDLQRLLARMKAEELEPPDKAGSLENLSCAAILSPEEPDLDGFFNQFPDHIRELCLVWDGRAVPDKAPAGPFQLRQAAHPLNRDFAAQRNRMLSLCSGQWVLCLDADERLPKAFWDRLPGLLKRLDQDGPDGVFLPRLTLFPDQDRFRAGYGLWPDLQLRLFRNLPGVKYQRPVHERLTGLDGDMALLPDQPILHLTHLLKRPEAIQKKLELFDSAAAGRISHTLNPDFPSLPVAPPYVEPAGRDRLPMLLLPARTRGKTGSSATVAGNNEAV